jgi:hypothetical protein
MKAFEILIAVLGSVMFLICLSLLLSLPVYFLWNECLVGAIDGVKEVTWLQAWGLNILSGFLFRTTVSTKKA